MVFNMATKTLKLSVIGSDRICSKVHSCRSCRGWKNSDSVAELFSVASGPGSCLMDYNSCWPLSINSLYNH